MEIANPRKKIEQRKCTNNQPTLNASFSTVRFLEPRASAATTELLGLAAPGIGDEQRPVISDEDVLDLLLGLLVDVLLVEGDEGLGDALPDGVDLGGVPAAAHADAHVSSGESVASEEKDGLERLVAEDLGLHELDRGPVHLDQPAALLAVSHRHRVLLPPEALDRFGRRRRRRCHFFCSIDGDLALALALTLDFGGATREWKKRRRNGFPYIED